MITADIGLITVSVYLDGSCFACIRHDELRSGWVSPPSGFESEPGWSMRDYMSVAGRIHSLTPSQLARALDLLAIAHAFIVRGRGIGPV